MNRWLKYVLLLNTVGGGLVGLVVMLPARAQAAGDLPNRLLLAVMTGIFCLGLYAGWKLVRQEAAGLRWGKAFLLLQLPFVSSPLFGYGLVSAAGLRLSCGVLADGRLAFTTDSRLGSFVWLSVLQGAPVGFGVNLVALVLVVLVARAQRDRRTHGAPA